MVEAIEVDDSNFDDKVIKESKKIPVIVDFWASWCSPCKMLSPVMEKVAAKYKGKIIVAKINVEANHEQALKYDVSGIPVVKMFKNGKVVDEFVGYIPQDAVIEWIEANLQKK